MVQAYATGGDLQTFSLEDIGLTARFVKEDFLSKAVRLMERKMASRKARSGGYKFDATGNRATNLVQADLWQLTRSMHPGLPLIFNTNTNSIQAGR